MKLFSFRKKILIFIKFMSIRFQKKNPHLAHTYPIYFDLYVSGSWHSLFLLLQYSKRLLLQIKTKLNKHNNRNLFIWPQAYIFNLQKFASYLWAIYYMYYIYISRVMKLWRGYYCVYFLRQKQIITYNMRSVSNKNCYLLSNASGIWKCHFYTYD